MLQPKKIKYRNVQKGRSLNRQITTKGTEVVYGDMGLQSLETRIISSKQLESCINALKKTIGKKGRFWLKVFPHRPKTKKPPETRMGGGKGDVNDYVSLIRRGTVIFEVAGNDKEMLKNALKQVSYRLPIKTKVIFNQ